MERLGLCDPLVTPRLGSVTSCRWTRARFSGRRAEPQAGQGARLSAGRLGAPAGARAGPAALRGGARGRAGLSRLPPSGKGLRLERRFQKMLGLPAVLPAVLEARLGEKVNWDN